MSVLLKNNYHIHTYRCGHASGSEEEYVLAAIKAGFKTIGISDHIFLPGFVQAGIRGDFSNLDDYIDTLKKLKEKYKSKINILIGFEAEYYPMFVDYYKSLLKTKGVDYLILGQHCYIEDGNFSFYKYSLNPVMMLDKYVNDVCEGIKTGLFSFVCHPDQYLGGYIYFDELAIKAARKIIETAIEYNVPLEININGIRARHAYPNEFFWRIVSEYKDAKVIINSDAHRPDQLEDYHDEAFALANKYNLTVVEEMEKRVI